MLYYHKMEHRGEFKMLFQRGPQLTHYFRLGTCVVNGKVNQLYRGDSHSSVVSAKLIIR